MNVARRWKYVCYQHKKETARKFTIHYMVSGGNYIKWQLYTEKKMVSLYFQCTDFIVSAQFIVRHKSSSVAQFPVRTSFPGCPIFRRPSSISHHPPAHLCSSLLFTHLNPQQTRRFRSIYITPLNYTNSCGEADSLSALGNDVRFAKNRRVGSSSPFALTASLPPMRRKPAVHGCTGSPPPPLLECSMADH